MKIGAGAIKCGSYSEGFMLESLTAGVVVVVESAGLVGNEPGAYDLVFSSLVFHKSADRGDS